MTAIALTTMLTGRGKLGLYRQGHGSDAQTISFDPDLSTAFGCMIFFCFIEVRGTINKCTRPTITSDFS